MRPDVFLADYHNVEECDSRQDGGGFFKRFYINCLNFNGVYCPVEGRECVDYSILFLSSSHLGTDSTNVFRETLIWSDLLIIGGLVNIYVADIPALDCGVTQKE